MAGGELKRRKSHANQYSLCSDSTCVIGMPRWIRATIGFRVKIIHSMKVYSPS